MTTRLDLIEFTRIDGKPCRKYGLQEVDRNGKLLNLFNDEADQLPRFPNATFAYLRTLGEMEDSDDFWNLVAECKHINPQE